ncbi:zinc finger and SCAN domain-containing protein 2-like [Anopheles aquasalis]|uniref:zinc finger and SCAN domain-containing protein 2-like n=1 Tax=Anopheles aquasalis TaxID=42839 RepID=UPI00215A8159|nr:zinc finger and SCAN domain-containing protein 2-like [Anopheles aquasalis]
MQEISLDPSAVCRFCLEHDRPMECLFNLQFLPELVANLTQLEITSDDPFSKMMCEQCATFAQSMFEFREKCIDSQRILKECIESRILVDEEQMISTHKVGIEYVVCTEDDDRGNEHIVSLSDDETRLAEFTIRMIDDEDDDDDGSECVICKEHVSGGEQMMELHLKTDHPGGTDDDGLPKLCKCLYCPKAYFSYELLGLHLNFHPRDQWQCPECDEVIEDKDEFVDHLQSHDNVEEFEMPLEVAIQQMQSDNGNDSQMEHDAVTGNVMEHQVEAESKGTAKSGKRKSKKTAVMPTQFVECGKHINPELQEAIKRHREKHHSTTRDTASIDTAPGKSKKKVYLCNICGHNCKSASNLAVHLRRHNAQYVCNCPHCGKGFPRRADLKSHIRQHTGEKPFVCKTCGRGFARQDKLNIHRRTHTGEKPYACPCGRSFAQRNDLKIHQKRNICGQNFDVSKMISPKVSICVVSPPSSP